MFKILRKSKKTKARSGILTTVHGKIKTPFFMPDATRGFIKLLDNIELDKTNIGPMVVNTYHLLLQPGEKIIKKAGDMHKFMSWDKPLLSDSGGFQVFSLIRQKTQKNIKGRQSAPMGTVTEKGVIFKSPLDGSMHELTPEKSIQIQFNLGVDMMVCLDDCPPNDSSKEELKKSVIRTIAWAKRCKEEYNRQVKKRKIKEKDRPLIFCVIQGGPYLELRKKCVEGLTKVGFSARGACLSGRQGPASGWDGYGFGARPVDKDGNFLKKVLIYTASLIPENALRFALGIGLPEDIVKCASYGWDMFDCVIPTREGRHGKLFLWASSNKKSYSYKTINISNSKFSSDLNPINSKSKIPELKKYSKAYLHHLFKLKEPLGSKIASLNNLEFYMELMDKIRKNIISAR